MYSGSLKNLMMSLEEYLIVKEKIKEEEKEKEKPFQKSKL